MEYDLYFLNNIHDSMDMVNVEFEPFLHSLSQNAFEKLTVKHIILNLASCLELLVKFRLEKEHWTLLFSELKKAKYSDYLTGDFVSVDINNGISRLINICEVDHKFVASKNIYKYRNRLMHYTLNNISFEVVIGDVSDSMEEIAEFVEKEIMHYLPQNAQDDFQDTIDNYKKYAAELKELKL